MASKEGDGEGSRWLRRRATGRGSRWLRTRAENVSAPARALSSREKRRRARHPRGPPRSLRPARCRRFSRLARRSRVATRRARRVRAPRRRVSRAVREPERGGGIAAAAGTRRVSSSDPDSPADATWRLRVGAAAPRPSRVPRSDLSVRADPPKRSLLDLDAVERFARDHGIEGARRVVVPRDLPPRQARLLGSTGRLRARRRALRPTSSCAPAR